MLRSMTGFGRCFLEEDHWTQTWEIRSVNNRFLDVKWRLPLSVRPLEGRLEKTVKRFAGRGRVEITLNLRLHREGALAPEFNAEQAHAMLDAMSAFASERGDAFIPDYNRLLAMSSLWDEGLSEAEEELALSLEQGLATALGDWNEARETEAKALEKDILARVLRMEEWLSCIGEQAPQIKEERFASLRERLNEVLEQHA